MGAAAGAPSARPVGSPLTTHLLSTPPTPRQLLVQCASLHSLLQQRAAAERWAGAWGRDGASPVGDDAAAPPLIAPSSSPLALRERPPGACSPEGMPCSITALARTPCVHAAHLARRCPSASPPPTLSPLLGSAISYSSRLLHMAGSGPSRAIPPYLFGKSLHDAVCAQCTESPVAWALVCSTAAGLASEYMIEWRAAQAFGKACHT